MTGRQGLRIGFSLVLSSLIGAAAMPAQELAKPSRARVDSIFARYDKTSVPGCALGVFRAGEISYARGYGMADLNQDLAIDPQTVFYIASTSKQFTAMAVALAAEEGLLGLDDSIRKWVPELPAYADAITVRHLVHHTSGIRDYLGLWGMSGRSFANEIPLEQGLDLIARQLAADFAPGAQWSYSNSGYLLLTEIVARASKVSFRQFAESRMFGPLGMSHTHFHDDNTEIVSRRAEGYQPAGPGRYRIFRTSFALVGDGGLLTTIEDLAKWDANFYHNRLGKGHQGLIDQVVTPGKYADGTDLTYAFGLMPGKYRGLRAVRHGGSFIGFRAELVRFPEQRFSVGVLCNDYTADPSALANQVADLYLADRFPPEPAKAAAASARAVRSSLLDSLSGRYEVLPGLVATVSKQGAGLELLAFGQRNALEPGAADTAWVGPGGQELLFARMADGRYGLLASAFGARQPVPELGPVPSYDAKALAAFVGRYTSQELDTWFTVEVSEGQLRYRARWSAPVVAQPIRQDVFSVGGTRLAFDRDRRGNVVGFKLAAGRAHGIIAERVGR
ncbi:MAG: serine hydrolase domain-containing protein [Gemmatimonadales bacterium]